MKSKIFSEGRSSSGVLSVATCVSDDRGDLLPCPNVRKTRMNPFESGAQNPESTHLSRRGLSSTRLRRPTREGTSTESGGGIPRKILHRQTNPSKTHPRKAHLIRKERAKLAASVAGRQDGCCRARLADPAAVNLNWSMRVGVSLVRVAQETPFVRHNPAVTGLRE